MKHTQIWHPERYARYARFVSELGAPVVELLDPQPGERILDLGCGDGVLTEKLVGMGCQAVGIDGSVEQVEAANACNVDAYVMDGQQLEFDDEFDAVFSNAALHWMTRADAVIAGVWRALKPGGRFVAEFGGYGNIARITVALSEALKRRGVDVETAKLWYFPTEKEYRGHLERQGFVVKFIVLIPRPTLLPGDIAEWLATFAESFIALLPVAEQPTFISEVQETLRGELCDANGNWTADYVRLRFAAEKPVA